MTPVSEPRILKAGTTICIKMGPGPAVVRKLKSDCAFEDDFERSTSRYRYGYLILKSGTRKGIAVCPSGHGKESLRCQECGRKTSAHKCPNCGSYDLDVM